MRRLARCTVHLNPGHAWPVPCHERAVGERDTLRGTVEPTCEAHLAEMERNGTVRASDGQPAYRRWTETTPPSFSADNDHRPGVEQ